MKIFCIGRNYVAHAQELNNPIPESPVIFTKPATAQLKNNQDFYYPDFSSNIHHECEIVLKINQNGKHIQEKFAKKYFDEITVGIDFTARDIQEHLKSKGLPWDLAKGFDGAAVIGDFIPISTLPDRNKILFSLKKNGIIIQKGNTQLMLYSFEKIISFLSVYFTLQKGDLIFTGTPAGVGEVKQGDALEGFLLKKKVFNCIIK